jgi:chondroitin 4-sulfotransferase 11
MLINKHKKFIFIHIQKTAGVSFERVLQQEFPGTTQWHGRHGRVIDGLAEMPIKEWKEYFSFAFVRNPWDRMVSWYAMIKTAQKKLSFFQRVKNNPFASELWNYAIQNSHDFESFLENCTDTVYDLGCNKSFAYNQIDYLVDAGGSTAVDFIGRFENISSDSVHVFKRLGFDLIGGLPRLNQSRHAHYSKWYNEKSKALIADRFAKDIELFGYQFEQC